MSHVAVVLAAGHATRFGSDKLSATLHGEPLLFHAIRAARAAPVERVIVVARPGLDTGTWTGEPTVEILRINSDAMSDSLKAGIAAAADADGHPVLLSSAAFPDIADLSGDQGAGRLLRTRDDVVFDDCTDPAIHFDVDRPEDLGWLASRDRADKN